MTKTMSCPSEIGKLTFKDKATWAIEWTIEDFFSYTKKDEKYNSPRFSVPGSQWYLVIFPNGCTTDDCVISLFLMKSFPKRPITLNFNLGVKKADGTVIDITGDVTRDFKERWHGREIFLWRSEMFRNKSQLAPSDALTVICRLKVENKFDSTYRLIQLSENFEDLLASKKFCDVTLKVQNVEFATHRSILATRSTFFAAMFDADMKEKNTGIVDIQDCDSGAFKDFLTYLYSGKSEFNPENVFELYRIAHKYDVEELQSDCVAFIVNNLSLENLYDAVILGDELDNEEVSIKAEDFFVKNFTEIIYTSECESFLKENWRLAHKLLKSLAADLKSKK